MAIKDWKEISSNLSKTNNIVWGNKKSKDIVIYSSSILIPGRYTIFINDKSKTFNSKQKALTFAKQYMRTH